MQLAGTDTAYRRQRSKPLLGYRPARLTRGYEGMTVSNNETHHDERMMTQNFKTMFGDRSEANSMAGMVLSDDTLQQQQTEHSRRPTESTALLDARSAVERERATHRLATVGEMTGGIAHDFRNLLAVIESGLRLAEKRADET